MSYTPPTIEQRGGLKVHLTAIGIDYDQFKRLREDFGDTRGRYKAIAKVLSHGRTPELSPRTIAAWYKQDDKENTAT